MYHGKELLDFGSSRGLNEDWYSILLKSLQQLRNTFEFRQSVSKIVFTKWASKTPKKNFAKPIEQKILLRSEKIIDKNCFCFFPFSIFLYFILLIVRHHRTIFHNLNVRQMSTLCLITIFISNILDSVSVTVLGDKLIGTFHN